MTNLATLAHKAKKPNKQEAHNLIVDLFEQTQDERLALLYKYFMPATPKASGAWVHKAVSTDKYRHNLVLAYSDGQTLTATDGYRLHREPTTLAPGYYDKTGQAVDNGRCTFPDVGKIFPKCDTHTTVTLADLTVEPRGKGKTYVYIIEGRIYNKKLIDEAFNGQASLNCGYEADRYMSPLQINHDDGKVALVMPMKD